MPDPVLSLLRDRLDDPDLSDAAWRALVALTGGNGLQAPSIVDACLKIDDAGSDDKIRALMHSQTLSRPESGFTWARVEQWFLLNPSTEGNTVDFGKFGNLTVGKWRQRLPAFGAGSGSDETRMAPCGDAAHAAGARDFFLTVGGAIRDGTTQMLAGSYVQIAVSLENAFPSSIPNGSTQVTADRQEECWLRSISSPSGHEKAWLVATAESNATGVAWAREATLHQIWRSDHWPDHGLAERAAKRVNPSGAPTTLADWFSTAKTSLKINGVDVPSTNQRFLTATLHIFDGTLLKDFYNSVNGGGALLP